MKALFTRNLVVAFLIGMVHFLNAQQDTIQVVFHVLHQGGIENISDVQIIDAVRILNEDFNKRNADTVSVIPVFQNIIGNAGIEFQLATIDPQGNPTTGIDRIYTTFATPTNVDSFYLNQWDQSSYLNIWTAKVGAVPAPNPLSPASADSFPEKDGIIILPQYVGSIGTGLYALSRALTHQVGHFLNLMHPWGNTNDPGVTCGDDSVSDTPITKGFTYCAIDSNAAVCTPGIIENAQNFMEYSYCSRMFTQGQVNRMKDCLNSSVGHRNNLRSKHITGIRNLLTTTLSVIPNPITTSFTLQLSSTPSTQTYFNLYDALGRPVKQEEINTETTTLQRNNLPSGIYFWQLQQGNKVLQRGKVVME